MILPVARQFQNTQAQTQRQDVREPRFFCRAISFEHNAFFRSPVPSPPLCGCGDLHKKRNEVNRIGCCWRRTKKNCLKKPMQTSSWCCLKMTTMKTKLIDSKFDPCADDGWLVVVPPARRSTLLAALADGPFSPSRLPCPLPGLQCRVPALWPKTWLGGSVEVAASAPLAFLLVCICCFAFSFFSPSV